jgi:hypothetical protein
VSPKPKEFLQFPFQDFTRRHGERRIRERNESPQRIQADKRM